MSIIAVPVYRKYVDRARITEARVLLGAIKTAQDVYYAEHGAWYTCSNTKYDPVLSIDARSNKYYMWFGTNVSSAAGTWSASVFDERQSPDYAGLYWWNKDPATSPDITVNGYKMPVFFYVEDGERVYGMY